MKGAEDAVGRQWQSLLASEDSIGYVDGHGDEIVDIAVTEGVTKGEVDEERFSLGVWN